MDPSDKLEVLESVAQKLSITIETHHLANNEIETRSGHCKIRGRHWIILDQSLPLLEKIAIISQTLKKFDLESIYLPAWLREEMENHPFDEPKP
ncbi:MAG: hypothetical protein COV66_10275 [Nitrospinae bacterium CG11_big_fil_rev_8_21_14_0_20_45_15]|nr:MAG: hypothetical protein COV66_10275 [Nitrospinae bacterium CG11_big_fil_rev_8_21_14_0_20_45_15]